MNAITNAEIAAVLDRAADHIDRVGWIQGTWYEEVLGRAPQDCPVCADGALLAAVYGSPQAVNGFGTDDEYELYGRAQDAFCRQTRNEVIDWNDEPGRTADEVTKAMRDTAAALRAEAAA